MNCLIHRIMWVGTVLFLAPELFAQVTVFSEDFEGPFPTTGGWIVGDSDPLGPPAYWSSVDAAFGGEGVHGGDRKAYCAGFGFGGGTNNPTYQTDMIAFMSRSIDLSGYAGATLSFWFKIPSTEEGVDLARVQIDGETVWSTNVTVVEWTQAAINLNRFVGGTRLLKFEFVSDAAGAFEGWYVDDILLTGMFGAGPPNDDFTNALVIRGTLGTTNGTNANADKEAGEPDHAGSAGGRSVWYRWIAPANGPVTFNTLGSSFDTLLAVYTGDVLTRLTVVATNDDLSDSFDQSQVSFAANSGTSYRIAVDGYNAAVGTVLLNWAEGAPLNDRFANAITLTGSAGFTNGNNFNATKETEEPDHADESGGASVWYRWTAPASGPVVFDTGGSALDTLLAVYTGSRVGNLSLIASNHYSSLSLQSRVDFPAVSGTVYFIVVDGFDGAEWTFKLNWHSPRPPRFTAIARQPGSNWQLTLTGGSGDRYEIQTSIDLRTWNLARQLTNVSGTVQFVEPTSAPLQFYRALVE